MDLTRRRFLEGVAGAGGASLAYEAMAGLGLLAAPAQAPFGLSGRVSSAWMQGAFDSAREVSTVLHRLALTQR